jgi:hypothetical protein
MKLTRRYFVQFIWSLFEIARDTGQRIDSIFYNNISRFIKLYKNIMLIHACNLFLFTSISETLIEFSVLKKKDEVTYTHVFTLYD